MQNYIDATPKGTFYILELAAEMAEKFIQMKYEYTNVNIYDSNEFEEYRYTEEIQDEFNNIYDQIETYLQKNKLK